MRRSDFESWWVETVYVDGGFDYWIRPRNVEAQIQRQHPGEIYNPSPEEVEEFVNHYIGHWCDRLGISERGYVDAAGTVTPGR